MIAFGSQRARLATVIFSLVSILLVLLLVTLFIVLQSGWKQQVQGREEVFLELVSSTYRRALLTNEYAEAQLFAESLLHEPSINKIMLADHRNRIVVSTSFTDIGEPLVPEKLTASHWRFETIANPAGAMGTLAILFSHDELANAAGEFRKAAAMLALPLLMAVSGIAWLLGATLSRPIELLTSAVQLVAEGKLDTRVVETGSDEIGRLGRMFNTMTESLRKLFADLRASEARLNEAQRISKVGGWAYDVENKKLTWTDEVYRIYGVSPDEHDPGDIGQDIAYYEDRAAIETAFTKAVESGEPYDLELKFQNALGESLWVRTMGKVERKEGRIVRVYGNIMDITDRKKAELALLKERDTAQRYFDIAGVMFTVLDRDGRVALMNPKGCEILGYDRKELIEVDWFDQLLPERLRAQVKEVFRQLMAGESKPVEYYENAVLRKDGEERTIAFHNTVITDDSGRITGVFFSGEDISERKQAETEIFSLSKFPAQNPNAVLRIDSEGIIRYANAAGAPLLAMWERQVGQAAPDDWQEKVAMVLSNRSNLEIEIEFSNRIFSFILAPIAEEGYVNVYGRDITDRKQAEQELEKHRAHLEQMVKERTGELQNSQTALMNVVEDLSSANAKLQDLDRLKSMFIASMSHELRTPLNSIIGFTGIILQGMAGELNKEQRDQLERVFRAGKHLLALITDVIDIAKIESGKIQPYVEEFLLADVVKEACDSMKVQIQDKGLALRKVVPDAPVRMNTDRRRLLQCLLNYLSNAVKFTEKGTITLSARAENGRVKVSVADTGIGIKPEEIQFLFKSFVRLESHLRTLTPGTGLGLYLTKKLATEVLGGPVFAESVENKGSTFSILIPIDLKTEKKHL